jgi:hypothetical protein
MGTPLESINEAQECRRSWNLILRNPFASRKLAKVEDTYTVNIA